MNRDWAEHPLFHLFVLLAWIAVILALLAVGTGPI